jgi:transcription elongation factor GreA
LSENAEYDAAKAQGMLEMRIAKLEEVHSNARLIDETHLDLSKVLVLSNVKIKKSNQRYGNDIHLGREANRFENRKNFSNFQLGKVMGKSVGEFAKITVPNGVLKFENLEISRD